MGDKIVLTLLEMDVQEADLLWFFYQHQVQNIYKKKSIVHLPGKEPANQVTKLPHRPLEDLMCYNGETVWDLRVLLKSSYLEDGGHGVA